MLPMVVAGGLCIALSFVFGIEAFKQEGTLAAHLMKIGGGSAFALMVPVLAGYLAKAFSDHVKLPQSMSALKPILIIPLVATLITGLIMIYMVGTPVAKILTGLTSWLQSMGTANAVILGAILGGMMCTDMGGASQ